MSIRNHFKLVGGFLAGVIVQFGIFEWIGVLAQANIILCLAVYISFISRRPLTILPYILIAGIVEDTFGASVFLGDRLMIYLLVFGFAYWVKKLTFRQVSLAPLLLLASLTFGGVYLIEILISWAQVGLRLSLFAGYDFTAFILLNMLMVTAFWYGNFFSFIAQKEKT